MCVTCGCSDHAEPTITNSQTGEVVTIHSESLEHTHTLPNGTLITHSHTHVDNGDSVSILGNGEASQVHATIHSTTISLAENSLAKNNRIAAQNREWFKEHNILALNLVSSPGAGKTTLLTRTIHDLKHQLSIHVIEGDQETANDAQKIKETGCNVIQINTGTGCHLEAAMVEQGLQQLNPPLNSIVAIENVGNLVCPALFDLGENAKVAILSVTEGDDKPIKYPHMFRASDVMILTKIDLLPYVQFNVEHCIDYAKQVNPKIQIFQVSATTGVGLGNWYGWLHSQLHKLQPSLSGSSS